MTPPDDTATKTPPPYVTAHHALADDGVAADQLIPSVDVITSVSPLCATATNLPLP